MRRRSLLGRQTAAPPAGLVTDLVSGFIHGYSQARKLRDAYASNILRVRRSSDDVEVDIGFSADALDESALTTFVGANDGFTRNLYDQVGSRNLFISIATFQPKIVDSGTVIKVSGKPYAQYDGIDDYLVSLTSATPITDKDCTVFVVFESQASDTIQDVFNEHTGVGGEFVRILSDTGNSDFNEILYRPDAGTITPLSFSSQQPQSTKRVYIFRKTGTTIEAYDESGSLIDTGSNASVFGSNTELFLGVFGNPTKARYFGGKIAELLINNTALSTTDRNTVLDNIKDFYSIV